MCVLGVLGVLGVLVALRFFLLTLRIQLRFGFQSQILEIYLSSRLTANTLRPFAYRRSVFCLKNFAFRR